MEPSRTGSEVRLPDGRLLPAIIELQVDVGLDGVHVVPERDARPDEAMVLVELRNDSSEDQSVAVDVLARDARRAALAYENTSVFDIPPGGRGIARVWIRLDDMTSSVDVIVKPEE